jgi:Kef-type K+ transport system membrane component KefB
MLVEQRRIALLLAGATLTVGAVGWTTGAWLQSRPWLPVRRDRLITYGCGAVALGVAIVALVAADPGVWTGVVGVGWLFAGLGMGLSMASTNLTVMAFSRPEEQGRNGASLNVSDALGSALFVALTGTLFAALQPAGSLEVAFGVLLAAMTGVALLAALVSLRIGAVRNELA